MKYGLIGERLGHSFSAEIHARLGGYAYELKELNKDALGSFMTAREFDGINVTIPYKQDVIPYLDHVEDAALAIGAVNTVVNRDGSLYGYNTDYDGLRALILYHGFVLQDKTVLVLGSGGTSKTAVAVAKGLGCRQVVRVSRTARDGCISYDDAVAQYAHAQVLINTTPCGMYPQNGVSAVDLDKFPALQAVVDVVFNPLRTKLICEAVARSIPAAGGLYMLIAQAAYAAEKFTGKTVDETAIRSLYKEMVSQKENVVLIGMPASGKSTVGRRLAEQLECTFVDTDAQIVEQEGPISAIFAQQGETAFRECEAAVIRQVASRQGCVIATGGGAVLRPENVQALKENGKLVFLDRSLELLVATADRPLSSDKEALARRYRERYATYCAVCDIRVPADGSVEDVTDRCKEVLGYGKA